MKMCYVYLAILLLMDILPVPTFSFGVFLCLIYFELVWEYRLQRHDPLSLSTLIFIPKEQRPSHNHSAITQNDSLAFHSLSYSDIFEEYR